MTSGWYGLLGTLESFPVLDTVTKEVVGINAPKILVTRSDTERMDVAVSEIGNTMAFGVGGIAVDQLFKAVFKTAQRTGPGTVPYRWAVIGRSLGIYSTVFSMMWAMPFIRNYITAKHTGRVKFTEVIQAGHKHAPTDRHTQKADLQNALAYYRGRALEILGLGAAGAVTSVGIARMAASSRQTVGKELLNRIFQSNVGKKLLLKGGQFAKFGGWPALLFWGVPAYGGWLHASRDPYEKKEQVLKFANFVACFFAPPVLINRWFQGKFQQAFPKNQLKEWTYEAIHKVFVGNATARNQALTLWMKKSLLGLGSSIVLLGTMPQLMNIYLTKRRIHRDMQARQPESVLPNAYPPPVRPAYGTPYPPRTPQAIPRSGSGWPMATYSAAPQFSRPVVF